MADQSVEDEMSELLKDDLGQEYRNWDKIAAEKQQPPVSKDVLANQRVGLMRAFKDPQKRAEIAKLLARDKKGG